MDRIRHFKWSILLVIIHLVVVLYFNAILGPEEKIPRQWDYRGEIGSYSSREAGLWFLWGMNVILVAAFILFPLISPRYKRDRNRFEQILPRLSLIISFFLLVIHLYMLLWASGIPYIRGDDFIFVLIGLLFIFLGNILPKIPSNYFAGVRTPWTLTSEKNWYKTHRVSGYVFVIGGIFMMLRGFFELGSTLSLIHTTLLLGFLLVYPILYSYIFFLKEKKNREKEER